MEFSYNTMADRIMVWLAEAKVAERKEIGPGVYANYDSEGRLIAVEALKASEMYDLSDLDGAVPLEVMPAHVPSKDSASEMTVAERKALAEKFVEKANKYSRDMGTRTWTRDDLYDRPKRYYQ